jgi:hypothetical protein
MATLIIDNMPESLFKRIQQLAQLRRQESADAVVEILEAALSHSISARSEVDP